MVYTLAVWVSHGERLLPRRRRQGADFTEDVEIDLAYQHKLRDALELPEYTALPFGHLAGLSDKGIEQGKEAVMAAEKGDFLHDGLAESARCPAPLSRWDAEKTAAANEPVYCALVADSVNAAVARE